MPNQSDRDRDDRFMSRDRERMGSWDDRSSRSWDRGYNPGRYEPGNYLGQGGQEMGSHWGNEMGHGYQYGHPGGMGLGQHGNFRHQAYSHLGQPNFGHLGPEYGAHMSPGYMGEHGRMSAEYMQHDFNRGPVYSRAELDERAYHESLGYRVKGWFQGHRGKGPAGYQRSDERIREHVCETLTDDDRVDASNIEVSVKDGEVTLSGTVGDRHTKRLAEDCIESLFGVKDVQNHIRVVRDESVGRSMTGVGTGSSFETPSPPAGPNGADKRHRV